MKANRETKRLFVGGLGQNISEVDLQNQFSRFGEVSDVEIITRKDDQGNPQKVFAYINIRVTETDLKKCMSVLNKSKWKGGTLQIQLAKESFLQRLAQEREEAKAKKEKSTIGNANLLEKMGVVDFHMKAVPGTEVPGHKNWVVSKFGRVLPILHLKNQHKRKIIKYDPSKYCHNLKKIGEDFTNAIPISSLTWELEGGDNPTSKKRQGKFSDFHCSPNKIIKVQEDESPSASLAMRSRHCGVIMKNPHLILQQTAQEIHSDPITPKSHHVPDSDSQKLKRNKNSLSNDGIKFEGGLRLMIAREENFGRTSCSSVNESENDPFEVVRNDFKSNVHKRSLTDLVIKNDVSCLDSEDNVVGNNCDYGDTEDVAIKNKVGKIKNNVEFSQMEKSMCKKTSLKDKKNCELSDHYIKVQKRKNNVELAINNRGKHLSCKSLSKSISSEDADSVSESVNFEEDEYNTMMKNSLHVTFTLADLGQLAGSDLKAPKEDTKSDGWETSSKSDRASESHRTSGSLHRSKHCIYPEEIVASLLEGAENAPGKQKSKENNLKLKFQAFKGTGCLYGKQLVKKSMKENGASGNINKNQTSLKLQDPINMSLENVPLGKLTPFQCAKKSDDPNHIQPQKRQFLCKSQNYKVVSPSSLEKGSIIPSCSLLTLKDKKSASLGAETPRRGFEEDCCHRSTKTGEGSEKVSGPSEKGPDQSSHVVLEKSPEVSFRMDTQESETDFPLSIESSSDVNAKDKQAEDNQKRLAALEARKKAKELQKKLVHNALANLDDHPEDKPTHIIFGSDSGSETEMSTWEQSCLIEKPVKEFLNRTSGKLFDSDEKEYDSEDDSSRFRIKPQFEGRAGKKLMDLQSHFGPDDRFRMDSRFLESDSEEEQKEVNEKKTTEEEELAAEKSKALNIMQSILHINLSNSASKGSVAAKRFKDIIHYDPTRHDHATYEKKRDDKPKESKAKRKKKREEAQKLPVVSKEMYYKIAMDLKEIFQATEDTNEKEGVLWNEDCDGEKAKEVHDPAALKTRAKQPSGFTFSFFDSDTKDIKEETYKVETVKPGKNSWQGASYFKDGSSEEEDVSEETNDIKPRPGEISLPEKETTRFFFFSKNDERLHGSDLFWKGVEGNISRNFWEARANNLRRDCQKKHKDAKRRVKLK